MVRQRSARRLVWRSAGAKLESSTPGSMWGDAASRLGSSRVKARARRWLIHFARDRIDLIQSTSQHRIAGARATRLDECSQSLVAYRRAEKRTAESLAYCCDQYATAQHIRSTATVNKS